MAYARSSRDPAERDNAIETIQRAIRELKGLPPAVAPEAKGEGLSSERLALYGSAQKRLSLMLEGEEWLNALREMRDYYQRADRAAKGLDAYPALNWLCACAVLHQLDELPEAEIPKWEDEAERIRAAALKADEKSADFWQLAARAEAQLILGIATGTLETTVTSITDGYLRAWRRGGTPRKLRSVLEQMDWLIDTLRKSTAAVASGSAEVDASSARQRGQLAEGVRQIRGRLELLIGGNADS
jgi:hypothetical protein